MSSLANCCAIRGVKHFQGKIITEVLSFNNESQEDYVLFGSRTQVGKCELPEGRFIRTFWKRLERRNVY